MLFGKFKNALTLENLEILTFWESRSFKNLEIVRRIGSKCLLNFLSLNYSRNGTLKGYWRLSWHAKAHVDFEILVIYTLKSHCDKTLCMPDIWLQGKDWFATMKERVLNRAKQFFYRASNTGPTCWLIAFQAGILLFWRTLFYSEMNHVVFLKEEASIVEQV